jgi:hypothetical protein
MRLKKKSKFIGNEQNILVQFMTLTHERIHTKYEEEMKSVEIIDQKTNEINFLINKMCKK